MAGRVVMSIINPTTEGPDSWGGRGGASEAPSKKSMME